MTIKHSKVEVGIGPPSRKRSCPDPDGLVAFAAKSSDSSQLVPGVLGRPCMVANDAADA